MHGFAGRCLTTRPLHRGGCCDCTLRADDGIRTRDPHLGKVMRYQLRYIRAPRARCRHVRTETIVHPSMATQISPRLSNQPTAHHILAENAAHASLRPRSPASAWLGAGSRGSVGERPLHTRKVAGSIPAGTTGRITSSGLFASWHARTIRRNAPGYPPFIRSRGQPPSPSSAPDRPRRRGLPAPSRRQNPRTRRHHSQQLTVLTTDVGDGVVR